jgi:hypothetical protein
VAAIAALVLLLVMAMDWYGSQAADLAHQIDDSALTRGAQGGATQAVKEDAQRVIARDEKNAWQEDDFLGRLLLFMLLASVFLPLFAAAYRAAGRRAEPPWTPSAFAAIVAAATALLLAFRILNEPGNDATTTVKIGAPLGLLALAAIGLGSAWAFQGEADWAEMRRAATNAAPGTAVDHAVSPATDQVVSPAADQDASPVADQPASPAVDQGTSPVADQPAPPLADHAES